MCIRDTGMRDFRIIKSNKLDCDGCLFICSLGLREKELLREKMFCDENDENRKLEIDKELRFIYKNINLNCE